MKSMPTFYHPDDAGRLYLERVGEVSAEAAAIGKRGEISPAREDRERIAVFGIDPQVAFCTPGASLFVPGAVEDNRRAIEFCYRNFERITTVAMSLDTHRVFQIFHPAWWRDERGEPPAPLTPIRHDDLVRGRYRPTRDLAQTEEYLRKLEEGGRYVLTVWPYHAMLGGLSSALVPAMHEMCMMHALVRDSQTLLVQKGEEPLTEMYSALSPEVRRVGDRALGGFNEELFRALLGHDRVYVFGQAKSHCVLSTLRDLMDRIEATDRSLASRVHILEDAMSPVPAPPLDPLPPGLDFPALADAGIADLAARGMRVCKTTDPL